MTRVNGHDLSIELSGPENGFPVLLLHHGLGSTRAWAAQVPVLAGAGYRVIAYDRWGYGASEARPSLDVPRFEADLQDLEAIIQMLGIPKAALVGHSDGGTISLLYASRCPEQCAALVAVAAHIYFEPKMDPGIQGIRTTFETDARFRSAFQRVHGAKSEQVFHNWLNGWFQERNLTWDMRPLLGSIACPALVVQGVEDEHATPQHARDLAAALTHAELWLEPGARHMLPQEQAEMFNRRLLDFLKKYCPG